MPENTETTGKVVAPTTSGLDKSETTKNKRTPDRRLKLQALLLLGVTIFGTWMVTQPWYDFVLPSTTIVGTDLSEVPDVHAVGSITGWELTHQTTEETTTIGSPVVAAPTPGSVGGLPQPTFLLLIAGVFGVLAGFMRQGFVGVVGLVALPIAWKQLISFRNIIEDPNFGGHLNQMAYGLAWTQTTLLVAFVVLLLLTIQVMVVNHKRRKLEREQALKEGRPVLPNPVELIQALVMPNLHRLQEQSEKRQADAKKDKKADKKA